jgi:hypothetical protein
MSKNDLNTVNALLEPSQKAEVSKHGWLTKQGAIVKNWKKRYFIVQNGRMSYFDGPNGKELGAISLAGCRCAYSDLNHPYEFTVATTSRTYYIIAENSQERESWMNACIENGASKPINRSDSNVGPDRSQINRN